MWHDLPEGVTPARRPSPRRRCKPCELASSVPSTQPMRALVPWIFSLTTTSSPGVKTSGKCRMFSMSVYFWNNGWLGSASPAEKRTGGG
ncbi:MAG TPA: hypothetical protein DD490_20940 [Acidobacteria bacterium]|nr:hypothetical protein [Acidobacteriota bacterium]